VSSPETPAPITEAEIIPTPEAESLDTKPSIVSPPEVSVPTPTPVSAGIEVVPPPAPVKLEVTPPPAEVVFNNRFQAGQVSSSQAEAPQAPPSIIRETNPSQERADDNDEILGLNGSADIDEETRPSGGVSNAETGGLWTAAARNNEISRHADGSHTSSGLGEVPGAMREIEKVIPITIEETTTKTASAISMGDSAFTATVETGNVDQQEAPQKTDQIQNTPDMGAVAVAKPPEVVVEAVKSPQMPEFHQQANSTLEEGIKAAETKLDESMNSVETIDKIDDPTERLEARQQSAQETFAKMRADLLEINQDLDRYLSEAQTKNEMTLNEAKEVEARAEELKNQSEAERIRAYSIRTKAQNDLERIQGEVAGKKAEISDKLARLDSLEV
jgi:predicted  nucleic acid-binding Zn-ribbon protein